MIFVNGGRADFHLDKRRFFNARDIARSGYKIFPPYRCFGRRASRVFFFFFVSFLSVGSRANSEIVRPRHGALFRGASVSTAKQDRPDPPDIAAVSPSCVGESCRNVQLDQFSNISGTGQCPGHMLGRCGNAPAPGDEIYLLIQMSRNEKDLSRTYRARSLARSLALSPRFLLLSFLSRSPVRLPPVRPPPLPPSLFRSFPRGEDSLSLVYTNKNNAASDEPSRRREGNDGCSALPTFIKKL